MKCPKCGFNSFESYDICKKCSGDLASYKQIYSITPLVLPLEEKEKLAAELRLSEVVTEQVSKKTEAHDDIFSFDLPDDSTTLPTQSNIDPFDFIEKNSESESTISSNSEDDIFADLLESSPTQNESPFTGAEATPAKAVQAPPGTDDFGLENFSWDDSPATTAVNNNKDTEDDFDTLFGDTTEATLK